MQSRVLLTNGRVHLGKLLAEESIILARKVQLYHFLQPPDGVRRLESGQHLEAQERSQTVNHLIDEVVEIGLVAFVVVEFQVQLVRLVVAQAGLKDFRQEKRAI